MLDEVQIRQMGVIDHSELHFHRGLTCITGETGAGKTMLLNGIGLILGRKVPGSAVRTGHQRATVDARFLMEETDPLVSQVREMGGDVDVTIDPDGAHAQAELLVTRQLNATGRSRAFCGGQAVPTSVLSEMAHQLIAIHGQNDQLLLRSATQQRQLVDDAGGQKLAKLLRQYTATWQAYRQVQAELADLTQSAAARAYEADQLRHGLEQLEELNPTPGEDEQLRADIHRLSNVEDVRLAATEAVGLLDAEETSPGVSAALVQLDQARKALQHSDDSELEAIGEVIASAYYQCQEAASDLQRFLASLVADPRELAVKQQRLADLLTVTRAYGGSVDAALEWSRTAAQRLASLDDDPTRREALAKQEIELQDKLQELADALHAQRVKAAAAMEKSVHAVLTELAMPHARLHVLVNDSGELSATGRDTVQLFLAANKGVAPVPLDQGASGGELSRVMLALEIAATGEHSAATMIFDEIDAGVGGASAVAIGKCLQQLAARVQVIVVTHLPQVAAFADRHLVVSKSDEGGVTSSAVVEVAEQDRVRELARMLAGQAASDTAQEHARELLAMSARSTDVATPVSG